MVDWIAEHEQQREIVKLVARNAAATMAIPDLTLVQASRLYREVEIGAQDFDKIVDLMEDDDDATDAMLEAAEKLQDIWSSVSIVCASMVRTMQGLVPIDLPDDD